MGIEGQISADLAEKVVQSGHGVFTEGRKNIHYGNGTVTQAYGTLETTLILDDEDGELKAGIPVKFQVIKNSSVLVGYRVIQQHGMRIIEDRRLCCYRRRVQNSKCYA